jgi:hypothetical protein
MICFCGAVSLDNVAACLGDLNRVGRLLVAGFELFDELKCAHAHNHATEDNVLVVEEGQRSAHSDVELRLVSVARAVSLAHAEHANFVMLHGEGLVFEFRAVNRAAELRALGGSDFAHLDVHTLDNAMDLSVQVGADFTVAAGVAVA